LIIGEDGTTVAVAAKRLAREEAGVTCPHTSARYVLTGNILNKVDAQ